MCWGCLGNIWAWRSVCCTLEKPLQTPLPPDFQLGSSRTELSQFCFSAKIFSLVFPTSFLSSFFYIRIRSKCGGGSTGSRKKELRSSPRALPSQGSCWKHSQVISIGKICSQAVFRPRLRWWMILRSLPWCRGPFPGASCPLQPLGLVTHVPQLRVVRVPCVEVIEGVQEPRPWAGKQKLPVVQAKPFQLPWPL